MDIRYEKSGSAPVFVLDGRIDSAGSIQLDNAIKTRLSAVDRFVVFDMDHVSYMSSAGIRIFSILEKVLRQKNGHLFLCSLQPSVAKVLEITGFQRVFSLCATTAEAINRCQLEGTPAAAHDAGIVAGAGPVRISIEIVSSADTVLKITGDPKKVCAPASDPDDLTSRTFVHGEYSAGTGALGETAAEWLEHLGELVTLGGAIFWRPANSNDAPDFLVPGKDAPPVSLHTAFSVALDGPFHEIIVAESQSPGGISLASLFAAIFSHAESSKKAGGVISVVMYANINQIAGTRLVRSPVPDTDGRSEGTATSWSATGVQADYRRKTLVSFGTCIDTGAALSSFDGDALDALRCQDTSDSDHKMSMYQTGLVFDARELYQTRDLSRLVGKIVAEEPCIDLLRLSSETRVSYAILGVSYISGIMQVDRAPVRITGTYPDWNENYEKIARKLNPDARELELVPLTGGFSGTLVFRVNAWDRNGRKMMPLVMKMGEWQLIEPEIRGYTDHVKRFIQNNATQVIGQERVGNYAGILYNFVGIRGAESRIFSLEDYYQSHTPEEILSVFDSLFRVVLRGWYGQPRLREMQLYREYNRFWKYDRIREYAAEHFGVVPETKEIDLPFGLGRSINPLWFVETILPERASKSFLAYEASVHGDLNLKNVLMDETNNLWLIDFAETRHSHILRDIVKMEAVIKGEMTPILSRQGLLELVKLDARFLSSRSFCEIPDLPHDFQDPELDKAFRCVQQLRRYADLVTLLDDDISQYYIGLLPYTLNMLSYTSVNDLAKEYGWISASLICKRLMEQ